MAECQLVSVSPWLRLGHSGTTGVFLFPLLPCFLFDTLSFSITTTQMKPGHAPSEWRNRQLPLVALQGLTYKEIWGNSSNPKTAPMSHAAAPLPLFPCASWSDDKCTIGGQWLWIPTKDRSLPCVRKLGIDHRPVHVPLSLFDVTLNYFYQENLPCIKKFWWSTQFVKQYRKQETSVKYGWSNFLNRYAFCVRMYTVHV